MEEVLKHGTFSGELLRTLRTARLVPLLSSTFSSASVFVFGLLLGPPNWSYLSFRRTIGGFIFIDGNEIYR